MDQAPVTCWPNAPESVLPGGLRAHTPETVSLSPRGEWQIVPEVEPALRLTPLSVPWGGTISMWGRSACALRCVGQAAMGRRRRGEPPP